MHKNISESKGSIIKKISDWVFPVMILTALLLLLIYSQTAVNYMKKGLELCATAVIPSLFPFMVIAELITRSGIGHKFARLFRLPMKLIFGVNETGASAFILGALCGFPIGTLTLVKTLDRGEMTRRELERLMTFCNIPGAAFVISTLGSSLLGDIRLGIVIYSSLLLSSVLIGVACRFIYKDDGKSRATQPYVRVRLSAKDFTESISSSAHSMLNVCAYVVFFLTLIGCLGATLTKLALPGELTASMFGLFEISSGVGAAAALPNRSHAILLCALIAGWSGLSVHFQIMSVSSGRSINLKPFFIAKTAQGVLCTLLTFVALKLFPSLLINDSTAFLPENGLIFTLSDAVSLSLFFSALVLSALNRIRRFTDQSVATSSFKKDQ